MPAMRLKSEGYLLNLSADGSTTIAAPPADVGSVNGEGQHG
jgi:hypothetical protein